MISEKQILYRRESVRKRAERLGYGYRSEDFAQEAALQLIQNPKAISKTTKQAFVDSIRRPCENTYNRAGKFTKPIFESEFEYYSYFIAKIGSGYDIEHEQIIRSELLDTISCFEVLKPRHRKIMELHAEGHSLVEISEQFGCHSSRISQIIKLSQIKIKKEIISKSLSHQNERKRKFRKSTEVSSKIQARPRIQKEVIFKMEEFCFSSIEGMVSFKIPKISQELFVSF